MTVTADAARAATVRQVAGVSYLLRRSHRARRIRLSITANGEATVTLPMRAPLREADALVASRRSWLERHMARYAAERARHDARGPLADGGLIGVAGTSHRLEVRALPGGRRSRVEHADEPAPLVRVHLAPGDDRTLAGVLEAWYRREARAAIERRIGFRAPQLHVRPAAITVRDGRSRWGSASPRGRLSFSWRLVLAPPAVLDYVVVHELAHLAEFGHTAHFWELVRELVPEADTARRWLREHARELHWTLE